MERPESDILNSLVRRVGVYPINEGIQLGLQGLLSRQVFRWGVLGVGVFAVLSRVREDGRGALLSGIGSSRRRVV
jgi:hypothetical protein